MENHIYTAQEAIALTAEFSRTMLVYEAAATYLMNRLELLSGEFRLTGDRSPIDSLQWRLKSPESIMEKLERRGLPFNLDTLKENILDVAGVRVICPFMKNVYQMVELLGQQDGVTVQQVKDYIKNPKPNGYRSVHLITLVNIKLSNQALCVPVEIQLRTIAMNCWASCEHQLSYKKAALSEENLQKLKQVADTMHSIDTLVEEMSDEIFAGSIEE